MEWHYRFNGREERDGRVWVQLVVRGNGHTNYGYVPCIAGNGASEETALSNGKRLSRTIRDTMEQACGDVEFWAKQNGYGLEPID